MSRSRPLFLLLAAVSCAAPPRPLDQPLVTACTRHVGHDDTVRDAGAAALSPPQWLQAQVFALAEPPAGIAVSRVASVIVREDGTGLRGRSSLPVGTLWLDDATTRAFAAGRRDMPPWQVQLLGSTQLLLAAPLTTLLEIPGTPLPAFALRPTLPNDREHPVARLGVLLQHGQGGALERLRIGSDIPLDACFGLFVPAERGAAFAGHLVQFVPAPPPPPAVVDRRLRSAANPGELADRPLPRPTAWQLAIAAVGADNRRPALLALVAPLDLPRCEDFLLTSDEAALIAITRSLVGLDPGAEDVRLRVEQATLHVMLGRIERGELTGAMRAAAERQLGALADDPAALQLALATCTDCTQLGDTLIEENRMALGDGDVGTRVVAAQWLADRGVRIDGYDPLADAQTCRQRLRRHLSARAEEEGHAVR